MMTAQPTSMKDFSYQAYCKFREEGVMSCEDCLSEYGECTFANFLRPLLVLLRKDDYTINDPKVYHCLVSIGWRILSLTKLAASDSEEGVVVRDCLEFVRPFLRNNQLNLDGNLAVMMVVVGQRTIISWYDLHKTNDVGPLVGTLSPGSPPTVKTISGCPVLFWNLQLGPVHLKFIYCRNKILLSLLVTSLSIIYSRVPSSGQFVIPGFERRSDFDPFLGSDVYRPQADATGIAQISQPAHWMQAGAREVFLVSFGKYDSVNKTFDFGERCFGYRSFPSHKNILQFDIYQATNMRGTTGYFLYAKQEEDSHDGKRTIYSTSKIIRISEAGNEKYSLKPSDHHVEWYSRYGPDLLDYLNNLSDLELPGLKLPSLPPPIGPDIADTLEKIDLGGMFGDY
jgi:hypothetical protein